MIAWLLQSIGISDEFVQHLDQATLAFQRPLALWLGLALLAPIGVMVYRRQRRNLGAVPPWLVVALSATRILILLLLVVALSGPTIKLDYKHEKRPVVAFLLDRSASMWLPAGPFESLSEVLQIARAAGYPTIDDQVDVEVRKALNRVSRVRLVQAVLDTAAEKLAIPLQKNFDVRYYAFARELEPLAVPAGSAKIAEPRGTGGSGSYLGDAIAKVLDEAGGSRVAGLVLFSDGQSTGGQSILEAAHRAAGLGVPVYAIPSGSTSVLHDVSIVDVVTPGEVAVGDSARVDVTIESQGLDGRTVSVRLLDGETLLSSRDLALRGQEQQQIGLTFLAAQAGARYLTVRIPPLTEEPDYLRANNTDMAFLRVSKEKIRVLYVDGLPRWDYRFLKNAMRRDHGLGGVRESGPEIMVEAEIRRRAADIATALPQTAEELAQYHTVIMGDASPQLFNQHFVWALNAAVREKGLGLIVMAGPLYMPHAYGDDLKDLLPVRVRPRAAGLEAPVYRLYRVQLTPSGAIHEAMRFAEESDQNQAIWRRLPPFYWSAAVQRTAPGATVLAWNSSVSANQGGMPLIAYHYAGQGKVMFVGTDSTWLWRQNAADRLFYRFWGQSIRFVARHDASSREASTLEVRPMSVEPGQAAEIELLAFAADGSPRRERSLTVSVRTGDKVRLVNLAADQTRRGRFTGTYAQDEAGEARIKFSPDSQTASVAARLRVVAGAEEMRHPNVNRATLNLLAGVSGGKVVELPDVTSIVGQLKGAPELVAVHREASLWDNWLMLVVLVLVYSLDVGMRRWRGLA